MAKASNKSFGTSAQNSEKEIRETTQFIAKEDLNQVSVHKIQILSETAFGPFCFESGKSKSDWAKVLYLQTCVKSKKGIGKQINVRFYAPVDFSTPEDEIKYNFRDIGEDTDLLAKDEYKYCLK